MVLDDVSSLSRRSRFDDATLEELGEMQKECHKLERTMAALKGLLTKNRQHHAASSELTVLPWPLK